VAPVPVSGDVIAAYENYLEAIPDGGGEGMDGILEAIAAAASPDELDTPWQATGLRRYVDVPIVVEALTKLEAEFDSPLPYYLVIRGYEAGDGKPLTATTGSVGVVAQLAKAHALGWLPLTVIPKAKESRRVKGGWVMHLEMVR